MSNVERGSVTNAFGVHKCTTAISHAVVTNVYGDNDYCDDHAKLVSVAAKT